MLVQKAAVSRTRWVCPYLFDACGGPQVLLSLNKLRLGHCWDFISTTYAAARPTNCIWFPTAPHSPLHTTEKMVRMRIARLAVAVAACQLLSTTSAQSTATFTSATASASLTSQNGFQSATLTPTPISLFSTQVSIRSSATSRPSSEPQVHLIKAGSGGFKFTPQELTNVSVGDIVTFEFYPPDHSVVQAEFGSACVPYSYADKDHAGKGFWTETQWVKTTADVSQHTSSLPRGQVHDRNDDTSFLTPSHTRLTPPRSLTTI